MHQLSCSSAALLCVYINIVTIMQIH